MEADSYPLVRIAYNAELSDYMDVDTAEKAVAEMNKVASAVNVYPIERDLMFCYASIIASYGYLEEFLPLILNYLQCATEAFMGYFQSESDRTNNK